MTNNKKYQCMVCQKEVFHGGTRKVSGGYVCSKCFTGCNCKSDSARWLERPMMNTSGEKITNWVGCV